MLESAGLAGPGLRWLGPAPGSDESIVLAALGSAAATSDEIARATLMRPGPLAAALASLEVDGLVTVADGRYRAVLRPT